MYDTHRAVEKLIKAGFEKAQAEALVYLCLDMIQDESAAKSELVKKDNIVFEKTRNEIAQIKSDIDWIKTLSGIFVALLAVMIIIS